MFTYFYSLVYTVYYELCELKLLFYKFIGYCQNIQGVPKKKFDGFYAKIY